MSFIIINPSQGTFYCTFMSWQQYNIPPFPFPLVRPPVKRFKMHKTIFPPHGRVRKEFEFVQTPPHTPKLPARHSAHPADTWWCLNSGVFSWVSSGTFRWSKRSRCEFHIRGRSPTQTLRSTLCLGDSIKYSAPSEQRLLSLTLRQSNTH